ncbi:hypothetical protein RCO48_00565 [Peribacillus frigoritolerans]|nr:hypothetical protein [Peribacillus frigoritolerans]
MSEVEDTRLLRERRVKGDPAGEAEGRPPAEIESLERKSTVKL